MTESYDVGAGLLQTTLEGNLLRVVNQWHESRLTIRVVSHENRKMTSGPEDRRTIHNELAVTSEEFIQRRSLR